MDIETTIGINFDGGSLIGHFDAFSLPILKSGVFFLKQWDENIEYEIYLDCRTDIYVVLWIAIIASYLEFGFLRLFQIMITFLHHNWVVIPERI